MKILVLEDCASSKQGGAERSMRAWCEYMAENKHPVYFVYEKGGDFVDNSGKSIYLNPTKINLQPVGVQGMNQWVRSVAKLYQYCKKNKIELIFTHTIHSFPILRIIKILYQVKIGLYFKWVYSQPNLSKFSKWGIKGVDMAFGNSSYVVEYWKKQGTQFLKEGPVVPDGIPASSKDASVDLSSKEERDVIKLLFAGRIYPQKGLHILIEALHQSSLENWKLYVAGFFSITETHEELEYHKKIGELIEKYGASKRIIFLGFVSNLRAYIRSVDLVVVPSMGGEAQSLVLMEAMAESVLVIAGKVGGIPERLPGNLSELLFNPSAENLSKKIIEVTKLSEEKKNIYRQLLFNEFDQKYRIEKTFQKINTNLGVS